MRGYFIVPEKNLFCSELGDLKRFQRKFDLCQGLDVAYDVPQIKEFSEKLYHVPIIDPNPRRGEKIYLKTARKAGFAQRSRVERVKSYLKDNYGGGHIRVKGVSQVMVQLMFGLIVITANQLLRLLC